MLAHTRPPGGVSSPNRRWQPPRLLQFPVFIHEDQQQIVLVSVPTAAMPQSSHSRSDQSQALSHTHSP
ncbi:hypothetical protein K1719_034905 [Acacia pycnantha]|nr:hypothetical protein K1719_034905 [Acacia pycnantha]